MKQLALMCTSWIALLFAANRICSGNGVARWGYRDVVDEVPPTQWQLNFPSCNGSRQSPIAINTTRVQRDDSLGPIEFIHYDEDAVDDTWSVLDNGHVVQFTGSFGESDPAPAVQGGGLDSTYMLLQLHFHWGSEDSRGSEHVINGRRLPLELHLVHRKTTDDDDAVVTDSLGLAVISVLFELAAPGDPENIHLEMLSQALQQIANPMVPVNVRMPGFQVGQLIPQSPNFFRYLGSLTTPPCSEDVVWSVMQQPMKITEDQLNRFRQVHERSDDSVDLLVDNFRPLQDYNRRIITYFVSHPRRSSTTGAPPSGAAISLPPLAESLGVSLYCSHKFIATVFAFMALLFNREI